MVHRDENGCQRCHGRGIAVIKSKPPVEVVCSCPAGKLIAIDVRVFARRTELVRG
jgi:hypothetical protein